MTTQHHSAPLGTTTHLTAQQSASERLRGHQRQDGVMDLAQSCKAPLGEGFLSSVGYLLWVEAAIALFAASTRQIQGSVLGRQFVFCGGGFSLWLCLDRCSWCMDATSVRRSSTSPTPSSPGCCCSASVAPLRRFGGDTFLVSVVLLGLSVLTDALQGLWPNSYETVQIFEEGFKFLGIAAWLSFWCHYVSSASKPAALDQH